MNPFLALTILFHLLNEIISTKKRLPHRNVVIISLILGPIPRAFAFTQFGQHNDDADALLGDHPPEISDGRLSRVLRYYKGFGVIVTLDERGIYVGGVFFAGQRRQDDTVAIVRDDDIAAVLLTVLFAARH